MAKLVVLGLVGLAGSMAQGTPVLTLDDGNGHSVSITDSTAGDQNSTVGAVTWSGTLGNWLLNVSTGVSKPALGGPTSPTMDLDSVNAVSLTGGTLKITFTDDSFTQSGVADAKIGGTSDGSVLYRTFVNGNPLTSESFSSDPFSGSAAGVVHGGPSYSLTQEVDITQQGRGITSFNALVQVPEGGIAPGLLGLLWAGAEVVRRRIAGRAR